jgi:hypothetical protein
MLQILRPAASTTLPYRAGFFLVTTLTPFDILGTPPLEAIVVLVVLLMLFAADNERIALVEP